MLGGGKDLCHRLEDALRSLSYGEAAAVQINGSTLLLMVRVDPLSVSSLDDLRSQILSDMKGGELDDALAAGGAAASSPGPAGR